MMNSKELEVIDRLPDEIEIYRGMTVKEFESGDFGISWTLNAERAKFFAYTYQRNYSTNDLPKMVHSMTINKNSIIAYTNGRDEEEIIYLHNNQTN